MADRAKVVSVAFAFSGFTVALVSGLGAGNAAATVLFRALIAMLACQFVGMVVGAMLARIIFEHEQLYKLANPLPEIPAIAPARRHGVVTVDEVVDETGTTHAPA